MPTNRVAIREGDRQARRQASRLGEEIRALRLRAGVTQAAVGRALGVDRTVVSRLERGDPRVGLGIRFRASALLGAELRISAYAGSSPLIRDAAQAWIIETILALLDPRWLRTIEAPVPGFGRRSVDLRLESPAGIVLLEIESRVGSLEEIVRELHGKREAFATTSGSPIHVVLGLPRTAHHLAIVRHHPRTIESAFPASSEAIESALADTTVPWPGDGILWTASATPTPARAVGAGSPDTLGPARPHRLEA